MADNSELDEQIQAQVEEWSSNSNECTTIELVKSDGTVTASFQPLFTYPIFGEEESIFGYHDLNITLSFAAHNLRPHVSIEHGKVFPGVSEEIQPTDIREALIDFLPETAFTKENAEVVFHDPSAASFLPPGEKVHEYEKDGRRFAIWWDSLSNPVAKELLENIQILTPMFIEGGSMLQLDQEWTTARWKVFFLYEMDSSTSEESGYALVGYGTSYRVFSFPNRQDPLETDNEVMRMGSPDLDSLLVPSQISPLELPSRERLAQFLILPTFHHSGHGQELYRTMYKTLTAPSNVHEFTVEDPNEAFDDLRDVCDLIMLRRRDDFNRLRINANIDIDKLRQGELIPTDLIVSGEMRRTIMKDTKMVQRQFDRLVEIHTLTSIPPLHRSRNRITRKEKSSNESDKAYYLWRLYVKHRLYIFNRDQLSQLERRERVEKLEATLDSVQEGYVRLLEKVEMLGQETVDIKPSVVSKRKRPTIEDDEDEDEDEEGRMDVTNGHSKKMRS